MKKIFTVISIFISIILVISCGGESHNGNGIFKQSISGRNGEVLVVINDDVKSDTAGRYLHTILSDTYLGLPAIEPLFDVQTVPHGYFDKMMHTFRNIIIVSVSDTISNDTILYYNDVWASPQIVASIVANKKSGLLPLIERHHLRLITYINKAERDRMISFNTRTKQIGLSDEINKKWCVDIAIPNAFEKCIPPNPDAMSWVGLNPDRSDAQVGMFVYTFPYIGEEAMSKIYILNKRDSLLQANVEGPDHSFMCTEVRFGLDEIIYKNGKYRNMEVAELRGLWRMNGCAMGGPFILRAVHDTINNRVVVTDGYVYYPSKDKKRNYIRQLEAIMYTLDIKQTEK